jgi:hypothetical protein
VVRRFVLIAAVIALSGCGRSPGEGADATRETTTLSPSAEPVLPLVGTWTRVTTCQELVTALEDAGLGRRAPKMVAGNGLVRGSAEQLAKKENICSGSVPREHSHYFTESGTFGSLNWNGKDVGHTTYELVDERTFTLDGVVHIHFEIEGDTLRLEPELPVGCKSSQCARAIAVAYPGYRWERTA